MKKPQWMNPQLLEDFDAAVQREAFGLPKEQDAMNKLHIVFDGPPGPTAGRFVECETPDGRSVNAGEWGERKDGFWELVIPRVPTCAEAPRATRDEVNKWCVWTKTGRRPSFFHPTRELAEAEAERLAAKTPGKKFMVMQIVSKISVPGPSV